MSEKLCTLRTQGGGGGAKQTETVLWTNSAPTSNFAAQTVTLSDDINNYDYIAVTYYCSPSLTQGARAIRSVADFKKGVYNTKNVPEMCLSYMDGSSTPNPMFRPVLYASDTTVRFYDCVTKGSSTVYNGYLQPLSIIGIKNMGGIRTNEKYDTLPFKSVSGNAIPTFATKGRAKAIWMPYMFQATTAHRSLMATNVNPATGEIDNDSYPWYIDTSNLNNYGQLSGWKFVVTDSSVTLSASPSTSNLYVGLVYTY